MASVKCCHDGAEVAAEPFSGTVQISAGILMYIQYNEVQFCMKGLSSSDMV